jgi:hypothetical protein
VWVEIAHLQEERLVSHLLNAVNLMGKPSTTPRKHKSDVNIQLYEILEHDVTGGRMTGYPIKMKAISLS